MKHYKQGLKDSTDNLPTVFWAQKQLNTLSIYVHEWGGITSSEWLCCDLLTLK